MLLIPKDLWDAYSIYKQYCGQLRWYMLLAELPPQVHNVLRNDNRKPRSCVEVFLKMKKTNTDLMALQRFTFI